jgi:peptidyl-prolyl cis-trans isomerase SurA
MKKSRIIGLGLLTLLPFAGLTAQILGTDDDDPTRRNVIDEVIWVVGDEPILKSEVEGMRLQAEVEGLRWKGDPDCAIPERIAIEKLFLHQAAIDSIEVTESEVNANVEQRIEYFITQAGSREKLEEYRGQPISQIRSQMREELRKQMMIQRMREKLVSDISVSPAEVRRYFANLPEDSIPFVPTVVEVEILTQTPKVEQEEINRIKDELREFTDRVNKGETTFQTLARMYSEDPGSARYGGELGFVGRGTLDPAFAAVAFNLTDPRKVSKVVESEYGFHIIQLIDKRGDKVNVRHILRKPQVSQESIDKALARLDSIGGDIRGGKFSFEEGATVISDDKDTRNNRGLMANMTEDGRRTSKFRMQDLPTEVARVVDTMQVNGISRPFQMINTRGKTVCAIVKLKSRVEGHRATITEDFQVMKDVVLNKRKEEFLSKWIEKKIKTIYVHVNDRYRDCQFEHQGWIK